LVVWAEYTHLSSMDLAKNHRHTHGYRRLACRAIEAKQATTSLLLKSHKPVVARTCSCQINQAMPTLGSFFCLVAKNPPYPIHSVALFVGQRVYPLTRDHSKQAIAGSCDRCRQQPLFLLPSSLWIYDINIPSDKLISPFSIQEFLSLSFKRFYLGIFRNWQDAFYFFLPAFSFGCISKLFRSAKISCSTWKARLPSTHMGQARKTLS